MSTIEKIDDNKFSIKCDGSIGKFSHWNWQVSKPFSLKCWTDRNVQWSVEAHLKLEVLGEEEHRAWYAFAEFNQNCSVYPTIANKSATCALTFCETNDLACHLVVEIKSSDYPAPLHDFQIADNHNDTALDIGGKQLYVSKSLLSVYSPVFNAMFNSDFREKNTGVYSIEDVDFDQLDMFLQVIYGFENVDDSNVEYLLTLADRFILSLVMKKCERFLLTDSKILAYQKVVFGDLYNFPDVQKKGLEKIHPSDIRKIVESKPKLNAETLYELLRISSAMHFTPYPTSVSPLFVPLVTNFPTGIVPSFD